MGQTRNSHDPDLEAELQALGERLRALRGRLSLRALAKAVHSSSSTLWRMEHGMVFPDATLIEKLDEFHGLDGDLVAQRQRLLRGVADRGQSAWRRRWMHQYPASYAGEVYVHFAFPASDRPARAHLRIRWGPWRLDRSLRIDDPEGVSCVFGKGDDGLSVPLFVTLDRQASASFGLGIPPGPIIDLNVGWKRVED